MCEKVPLARLQLVRPRHCALLGGDSCDGAPLWRHLACVPLGRGAGGATRRNLLTLTSRHHHPGEPLRAGVQLATPAPSSASTCNFLFCVARVAGFTVCPPGAKFRRHSQIRRSAAVLRRATVVRPGRAGGRGGGRRAHRTLAAGATGWLVLWLVEPRELGLFPGVSAFRWATGRTPPGARLSYPVPPLTPSAS